MDTKGRHRGRRKLQRPNRRTLQVALLVPLAVAGTSFAAFGLNTPLRTAAGHDWFPEGYTVVAGPDDDESTTELGLQTDDDEAEPDAGSDHGTENGSGRQRPPVNSDDSQSSEPTPDPTGQPGPSPTSDPSPSPTDSPTSTPQPPTPDPTPTATPSPTPTSTPTPTPTPTPTATPSPTPTSTPDDPDDDDGCLPLPLPLPLPCADAPDAEDTSTTGLAPTTASTIEGTDRGYAITQWLINYRASQAGQ